MKKWTDGLFVKCFAGKLGNDFIKEDEDVAEARLAFLEKNKRYTKYIMSVSFWPVSHVRLCITGLEIATDTGAFATKLFTFATKISRSVAN